MFYLQLEGFAIFRLGLGAGAGERRKIRSLQFDFRLRDAWTETIHARFNDRTEEELHRDITNEQDDDSGSETVHEELFHGSREALERKLLESMRPAAGPAS